MSAAGRRKVSKATRKPKGSYGFKKKWNLPYSIIEREIVDSLEEYNLSHEDNETVALLEDHIVDHLKRIQLDVDRLLEEDDGKTLVSDNAWNTG
jgi:hypothetical protein